MAKIKNDAPQARGQSKHPYVSGTAGLNAAIAHLRRSFPALVTADTLKKLSIAPNNETYVLNILRFLKLIDADGNKNKDTTSIFFNDDEAFKSGFETLVKEAYADLFDLHGDAAWQLDADKLISYFRSADHTSSIVGGRQAGVFQALAAWSGHGTAAQPKAAKQGKTTSSKERAAKPRAAAAEVAAEVRSSKADNIVKKDDQGQITHSAVGLTVRIEINLPAGGDRATYDAIFKSIRENLIDANGV